MEKIIITIISVKIELTIIPTIVFEFENMMNLFSMSLLKTLFNWELWNFVLKNKIVQLNVQIKLIYKNVSSCSFNKTFNNKN